MAVAWDLYLQRKIMGCQAVVYNHSTAEPIHLCVDAIYLIESARENWFGAGRQCPFINAIRFPLPILLSFLMFS